LLDPPEGGRKRITPGQTILLRATATDSDVNRDASPIADFRFLVDGQPFPDAGYIHSPVAPGQYEYPWAPPMGTYRLSVQATDSAGKVSVSAEGILEVRYPPAGSVREEFIPPSADNHVQALAADPQGRVYIGGLFTNLDGDSAPRIARLTATGSVDPTFYVGIGPDAQVRALLHVPQDKGLYVGGHFANVDGTAQRALVRLRTGQGDSVDGSVDPAFAPTFEGANSSSTPYVRAIVRQDDGKILVGGFFSKVNGVGRTNLVRLNPDGTLDTSFAPNPGGAVHCLALQSDGKILVGGSFTQVAGLTSRRIARLNRDGTVDTSFVTGTGTTGGFDGAVNSIAVTLDGEVIAGGQFTSYNGRNFYNNMAKLLPSGAVDGKFNFTPGLNGVVNDLHLRPTGTILVSGLFTSVANNDLGITATPVGRIAQMLSGGAVNGTLDADFNPGGAGANGSVLDSITLANGDILVGGAFTTFNGVPRERLAVVAGFEASSPMITSPLFRSIDAGSDLDFAFESAGEGTVHYAIHSGALPRGVRLNSATGKLEGIPLDAGRFKLEIVATSSVLGSSDPTGFVLHVNEKKVPYAQWKRAWFTPAEQANSAVSAPAVVRNNAGLNNYMVYALGGGDPDMADASLVPVVRREKVGTKEYLTLTASKYPGSEATYRPELSSTLSSWHGEVPGDLTVISDEPTQIKVRATVPATEASRQFLRLKLLAP
jgi:uncharacterized delta-60 repeat protein